MQQIKSSSNTQTGSHTQTLKDSGAGKLTSVLSHTNTCAPCQGRTSIYFVPWLPHPYTIPGCKIYYTYLKSILNSVNAERCFHAQCCLYPNILQSSKSKELTGSKHNKKQTIKNCFFYFKKKLSWCEPHQIQACLATVCLMTHPAPLSATRGNSFIL